MNSLFEDFCEYGLGMQIAHRKLRERLAALMQKGLECADCSAELKEMFQKWLDNRNDAKITNDLYEPISNTGGQASKATPLGAIAKFAAMGKRVRKKDLGMIATTYGYVYVAQIAMGADQAQTLKAIREAEAYPGPSLIIAYAPCINHGLKAGMGKSQAEEAKAVECGYWHLWRYNPELEAEGKNPFQLDSKEPQWDKFQDYLKGEVRFASVAKQFPKEADELFAAAQENAQWRYKSYLRMLGTQW